MSKKKKIKIAAVFSFLALALTPAFVRAYTINGPSMAPSLQLQDRVIAFQAAYDLRIPYLNVVLFRVSDPARGDVVIYHDLAKDCVAAKRVIGLPGDQIELKDDAVYVNAKAVEREPFPRSDFDSVPPANDLGSLVQREQLDGLMYWTTYTPEASKMANYGPVTLPPDRFFFLGDNRDNSADSRLIGLIARDQIKGRVIYGVRRP